jgi:hypothetical protein
MRSMRSLRPFAAALVLSIPFAFAGCKQGVGDRCQTDSDCDDGLVCVLPSGGTPQTGGTCQMPGNVDGSVFLDQGSPDGLSGADL